MFVDFIFIKLCGLQSLVKKNQNPDTKKQKEEDEFAISVYRYDLQRVTMVGHIPWNRSKFVYKFL